MTSRYESQGLSSGITTPTPSTVKDKAEEHGATTKSRRKRGPATYSAAAAVTVGWFLWKRSRAKSR